mgnify:CR=1 FL=1
MNAPRTFITDVGNGIGGAGQTHPVYGAAAATTKEATKGNARLRGAGAVRHSLVNARPSRTSQDYAGVVG